MRVFVSKGYHLGSLSVPARLVYTIFLVFIGVGTWTSWRIYADRIGGDLVAEAGRPSVAERYVEGGAASLEGGPEETSGDDTGGPAVDLPEEGRGPALNLPEESGGPAMDLPDEGGGPALDVEPAATAEAPDEDLKWPWILDVFHQHLFSVSVVFLILAHLFMLTRLHAAVSGTIIVLAGLTAMAHVFAPVVIHETGGWLWLMPVSGAGMLATWTLMIAWTLLAMWFGFGRAGNGRVGR
ncbi:MAG: hypothetical protein ACQEXJ_10080 [Myxococcota bacterium]